MTTDKQTALGSAPIGSLLFKLALPTITAQLVNVLYNMVDRMYIGHIPKDGADALTGLGVCMPLIVIAMAFAALAASGGAPRSSIFMGKSDHETAEKILGNCTTGVLITGVVLTAILLIFGQDLLMLFGASENTISYAWDYMKIYACGTIFVLISLGLNTFITAQGFTKISMLSVLIGAIANIILDPIFIFLMGMGVKGAALATIISQALSAAWILKFLCGSKTMLRIKRKNLKINSKIYLPCIALGLAPFMMQGTEGLITLCFNTSLLKYAGDIAVGSMTILTSVIQFSMLPLTGLTQGAQPIISYNFGARQYDRVKQAFLLLLKACLIFSTAIWALSMFTPKLLINIFTSNPDMIEYAATALRVYMSASLLFGIQIACQQTFLALGNAKTSLFLAILRKLILLIPLIHILPHFIQQKDIAVFLAEPVADTLAVITTATLFFIQFKKITKAQNYS